jgi:ABC-type Fe3+ transport system permease subunit
MDLLIKYKKLMRTLNIICIPSMIIGVSAIWLRYCYSHLDTIQNDLYWHIGGTLIWVVSIFLFREYSIQALMVDTQLHKEKLRYSVRRNTTDVKHRNKNNNL